MMDLMASGGLEVSLTPSGPEHPDAPQNWKFQVNSDSYRIFLLCQLRSLRRQEKKKKRVRDCWGGAKEGGKKERQVE